MRTYKSLDELRDDEWNNSIKNTFPEWIGKRPKITKEDIERANEAMKGKKLEKKLKDPSREKWIREAMELYEKQIRCEHKERKDKELRVYLDKNNTPKACVTCEKCDCDYERDLTFEEYDLYEKLQKDKKD